MASYGKTCLICLKNNAGTGINVTTGARPQPSGLFAHLMMDFIKLTAAKGKKYCLLIVGMFSKCVEAFPRAKQDTQAVVKALVREIIPKW